MQTRNRSAVVTESAAQAVLRRGPARALEADEERAVRMRLGATVPQGAPLERKITADEDARIEMLAAEIEMFMRMRDQLRAHAARRAAETQPAAARAAAPSMSPTKAKIVRALRKKR